VLSATRTRVNNSSEVSEPIIRINSVVFLPNHNRSKLRLRPSTLTKTYQW